MKKVFLHGALGKRFGREWDLNVSAPCEAVSALFANEPLIEKYLFKKQEEGITYGVKTSPDGDFMGLEDGDLKSSKDFHIFPVPQGAAAMGFVGSLLMMAAQMGAAMYVNKKFAEAMERDESTVTAQTKSYIYKGSDNRPEQGGTIPVGYGRMKVGSNVISSCILNYDFDDEEGKMVGLKRGAISLIPQYSKYYLPTLGPLFSSTLLNLYDGSAKPDYDAFDGSIHFNAMDPAFQMLQGAAGAAYGANDGMYGGTVQSAEELAKQLAVGGDAESSDSCVTEKGNMLGGYFTYSIEYGVGVDPSLLPGFDDPNRGRCGDWAPSDNTGVLDPARGLYWGNISGDANAAWSTYTCIQSVPQLESSTADSIFYPINFKSDPSITSIAASPIKVGQRWKGGNKENGVGWYKLGSLGIYKSVDLVCEGVIEGFSTADGETVPFNPGADTNKETNNGGVGPQCVSQTTDGDCLAWRYPEDDYLQGVYLGDTPVKEVSAPNAGIQRDTYNINEFDIDVGIDKGGAGNSIGGNNQTILEPQYQFTAHTVEKGGKLYGHRALTATDALATQGGQPMEFTPNTPYKQGTIVGIPQGEATQLYVVLRSTLSEFNRYEDYTFSDKCNGQIVNKVYDTDLEDDINPVLEFYLARESFMSFSGFESSLAAYQPDDTFIERGPSGFQYYRLGEDASGLLGEFNDEQSYDQVGSILFPTANRTPYKITGAYDPNDLVGGRRKTLNEFTDPLTEEYTTKHGSMMRTSPPLYMISRSLSDIVSEVNISPGENDGPAADPAPIGGSNLIDYAVFQNAFGLTPRPDIAENWYSSSWFFRYNTDAGEIGGSVWYLSPTSKNPLGTYAFNVFDSEWIYLSPAGKDATWWWHENIGWQWTSKEVSTTNILWTYNNYDSTLGQGQSWLWWIPSSTLGSEARVYNMGDRTWREVDLDRVTEWIVGTPPPAPTEAPPKADVYWTKISINSPGDIRDGAGARMPLLELNNGTQDDLCPIFMEQALLGGSDTVRRQYEEYYLTHTVINPLVEELYVSLSIDELVYVYGGDNVEVTYRFGELLMFLLLGVVFYGALGDVTSLSPLAALGWAALAAAVGTALLQGELELSLGNKVENSGETWPAKGKFRIKYGNVGEEQFFTDVYVYGVATSAYRKDVKIYLPPNPAGKDRIVKVYKLNRERNPVKEGEQAARYKESLSLGAITEIVPINLSYPNSVVIGTRVNARDWPNIPTRNYNLKLKKVAVPSNYNTKTREYDGNWDGLFKGQAETDDTTPESLKEWTDNPAWCLYDLMSDKRYGVGKFGIKAENIDRWTLYKIAKYCDVIIPTGYSPKYPKRNFTWDGDRIKLDQPIEGGYTGSEFHKEFSWINKKLAIFYADGTYDVRTITGINGENWSLNIDATPSQITGSCAVEIDYPLVEPRYTLNAYLMTPQNAFKLINEFAAIFRAYAYWAGDAIHFFQDERKDAVMLFTNNNISAEGFSYSSTPKTSRTNSCKIKYLDRYNMYRPKMEHAENRDQISKNSLIEQSIDGFGITSKAQAKRAAEFVVQGAALETETLNFKTSSIGSYLRPGDIVDVLDNKRTVGRFAGKVLSVNVSGDGKMADIDIDFPIRSVIDENDKDTWKKITLYSISGNETISSLDALPVGTVTDQDIDNMRAGQIGEYVVSNLSQNDTRLRVTYNPYELITGTSLLGTPLYSWPEALADARDRGGMLATIDNAVDQSLVDAVLPTGTMAWVGGYYKVGRTPDPYFAWFQPQECTTDAMDYTEWAAGYPTGVEALLETDASELIITDDDDFILIEGSPSFIAVSGSADAAVHGDWVNLPITGERSYILEKKDCSPGAQDSSLLSLAGMEGTSFVIEDKVNLATKKQYKVLGIAEESNGIFQISAMQYNSGKFGNIENNASLPSPQSPVIFTQNPVDPPNNISCTPVEARSDWVIMTKENAPTWFWGASDWATHGSEERMYAETLPAGLSGQWDHVAAASAYRVQFCQENTVFKSVEVPNSSASTHSFIYRSEQILPGDGYYIRVYSIP
jgi:predicted phage tail protein